MENNNKKYSLEQTLSIQDTFIEVYKYTLKKSKNSFLITFLMGLMSGLFVGFGYIGSLYATRAWPEAWLPGFKNITFGVVFTLAITMIVFMGGELFTSNSMMFLATVKKQIKVKKLILNLLIVLFGNFVGCFIMAGLTSLSGFMDDKDFLANSVGVFNHKLVLPWWKQFFSGVLCNFLVAGSVYISHSTKSSTAKFLLIFLLIWVFALSGFSHVVANGYIWFLGPIANFNSPNSVSFSRFLQFGYQNQLPTLFGNFVGGGMLLPVLYYLIFRNQIPKTITL